MVKNRVLLDSNVVISGTAFGGNESQVLSLAFQQKVECVISSEILLEIEKALIKKLKVQKSTVDALFNEIKKCFIFVETNLKINIVRDPSDNKIIEAAVAGGCKFIITGDKDLLDLKKYKNIKILTPKDFLEEISKVQ